MRVGDIRYGQFGGRADINNECVRKARAKNGRGIHPGRNVRGGGGEPAVCNRLVRREITLRLTIHANGKGGY